jgi:DNA-binding Lrp family transcriptional regulator
MCFDKTVMEVVCMINEKYLIVFQYLRQNSRFQLTQLSRKTGIPITTIYDQIRHEDSFVRKYTALLDFEKLGYHARFVVALSVSPKDKQNLREYLLKNHQVNSLFSINNGYDFLAEGIFKQLRGAEKFIEEIEQGFSIKNKHVHYITNDLKQEAFLSNPYIPYSS